MSIINLRKARAASVMGIDCSTNALAFTVFENGKPKKWGKFTFNGSTVFERIVDSSLKVTSLKEKFDVDYIAMEAAILAKGNVDVTIKLSYVYGAVLAQLLQGKAKVVTVRPTEWQAYIGNKSFTKLEKNKLKLDYPGKSVSWYTTKIREIRKQRTIDFCNEKWDLGLTDDDVADSCAIAWFAWRQLTSRGVE